MLTAKSPIPAHVPAERVVDFDYRQDPGFAVDPPQHTPYRRALSEQFSPQFVRTLEPKVRAMARELIDQIAPRGECEFVDDMAFPMPVKMLMPIIGFPPADYPRVQQMANQFF